MGRTTMHINTTLSHQQFARVGLVLAFVGLQEAQQTWPDQHSPPLKCITETKEPNSAKGPDWLLDSEIESDEACM